MGVRVDNATNGVEELNGLEVVFCAHDGDMAGQQGYAPVEYAENHWIDVDGALCCSVACAAFQSGMSAEDADRARGIAADGGESFDDGPLAAPLGAAFDEDTHEHDQTFEVEDSAAAVDERFSGIVTALEQDLQESEDKAFADYDEDGGEE